MNSRIKTQQQVTLCDILVRHLQESLKNKGLLLLTLPTGFGKTYYVLEYIKRHLLEGFPQKVWFVTNLKKNLPLEKLKTLIGPELFEQHVLFLNSYSDQVLTFFKDNDVPEEIQLQLKSYKGLRKAVEMISKSFDVPVLKDMLGTQLAKEERQFRMELKKWLSGYFRESQGVEEKLKEIRQNPKLSWIVDMYPSVQFYEKKIFFCSIDKFYRYLDTIIGPNIQITTPEYIKDNVIFIDEFDATKQNIKNAIIDNAIKFNQDIINLSIRIFHGVQSRKFPGRQLSGANANQIRKLREAFEELERKTTKLYEQYHLHYHYFYDSKTANNRAFLFHDFEYHAVYGSSSRNQSHFLSRRLDSQNQINYIEVLDKHPEDEVENLLYFLNDLRGLILLFSYFIHDLAEEYKKAHDHRAEMDDISMENAIRTALDIFDLTDPTTQNYFIDQIFQQVSVSLGVNSTKFDLTATNKGFRYYDILNRKSHDATSKILYADTLTTPETWLLHLCKLAHVIGISATAGFDSPISNYSLQHLRHHLGERFFQLSQSDKLALVQEFQQKHLLGHLREIRPVAITAKTKKKACLEEIFTEPELVNKFLHSFHNLEDFHVQRYIKVAIAYRYYLTHPDIHSFLCLLNKFPKAGKEDNFQLKFLKAILTELRIFHLGESEEEATNKVDEEVEILGSAAFEEHKTNINKRLSEGNKIFLISTYQTMGAGQNIQYPAPDDLEVVAINNLDYGVNDKDYDGIYLEKPTYLLNYFPPRTEISDKDLLDYLFELEYLAEGGAISRKQKKERIQYAFRRRLNPHTPSPKNQDLSQRTIIAQHFSRVIIQAVGRLARTRLKSPVTHLLYDSNIKEYLQYFQPGDDLFIPEFKELYRHCMQGNSLFNPAELDIHNQNIHHSFALATMLRRLTKSITRWDERTIQFWENLRQFVLKHPTLSDEQIAKTGFQKFYIKSLQEQPFNYYFFESQDDFRNNLSIHYDQQKGREVSTEAIQLPQLLQIEYIEQLFIEQEYAQSFEPNEYIMSPPFFQNIYLGALGEKIGQHLFIKFGIKLQALDQKNYELFDFKITDEIYVDFKFWRLNLEVDASRQKAAIKEKMEQVGAKKAFIVNIISPGQQYQIVEGTEGIIEIPGLIDLEQGKILEKPFEFIHQTISAHGR